jgi:signal transduction histidine kinase/HAMP domain-containing protein
MVLVLMAIIPAFGVIVYSASRHRDLIANQVQKNALGAVSTIAAEQERSIENAHQFLIMLAQVPQIRERNKSSCGNVLARLLEPLYADLIVTDAKGDIVCRALPAADSIARLDASDRKRVTETHDFFIGKIYAVPPAGKTVMTLSYPILASTGSLHGIVAVALDVSWVTRITAEEHLYPGATFSLVDTQGTILFRYPQGTTWIGKPILADPAVQGMEPQDSEKTFRAVGLDGVSRLFAFSQLKSSIGGKSVYAAIDVPTDVAFAEARAILVQNLALLALVSTLALVAAWLGADLFVLRRIRDLVRATKQVEAGKLSARTQLRYGKSELGHMARAFDELAGALERREAEAEASANQIEKQRQRQKALYDLNLAITSTLDLSTILSILLAQISELFPTCAATVSWINRASGVLETVTHRNFGETNPMSWEEGLPLVVLKNRSLLNIANAQVDPRTTNPEFFRRYRLFSYLGLPLIAKGETLGVLSFYTREKREFNPEEIDFLTALVSEAAIAISNSRLYEQTRDQALELEKSNKIKDEFLGVMSHELRTPLNIIMNYAEALRMGMFGEISGDQKMSTEKIRSQAQHLLALINGILEITKIESGIVNVQKERFDLVRFMAENRSDYMMPSEKQVMFQWNFAADLPTIVSDRIKLKQILTNLINNAIKFTEQGSIAVSAQTLNEGATLEIKVADTGVGIPEEMLPYVFEKFRQIDSTMTRSHSGVGLGLYIVKTFVERLEGTISVESKVGEGSTFVVRLPIEPDNTVTERQPNLWACPEAL